MKMGIVAFSYPCVLPLATPAFADQAIWISKETAQQAVAILEKEKFYYDYCAPCEDKFAEKVIIKNVEMIQKERPRLGGYSQWKGY